MTTIPIRDDYEGYPLINEFRNDYSDMRGVCHACILMDDVDTEHENSSHIYVRIFIENPNFITPGQNYILATRWLDSGECATIDIISLKRRSHKDILFKYCSKIGYINPSEIAVYDPGTAKLAPVAIASGCIKVTTAGDFNFKASQEGYEDSLFGVDCGDIARYLAYSCNLDVEGDIRCGGIFLASLLERMTTHRGDTFFDDWISIQRDKHGLKSTSQLMSENIAALRRMKVWNKSENKRDRLKILLNEDPEGICRELSAHLAVNKKT